jgi:Helix-turn-helix domain
MLWDCPKPGCPRTENVPKELSVEQAVSDQPIGPGQPAIMRVEDVVEFLKLPSVQTVHSWNKKGVGPPYFWAGHQMRYRRREVLKWFVERTGPYAGCGSECGRAFPLRDFKKVTGQQ